VRFILSKWPGSHPSYTPSGTLSTLSSIQTWTPSPHSSVPTRTPSPHSSVPTRTPSPQSSVQIGSPTPYPYTLTRVSYTPNISDYIPSDHSLAASDDTSIRYQLYSTPNPQPPYYPTIKVVINPQTYVYDGTPFRYLPSGFNEMQVSIQEDFCGIEMGHHRAELIRRLDRVLERLNRGLGYFGQHNPAFNEGHLWRMKDTYRKLRETLLRVDAEAEVIGRVVGSHTTFMCALPLPCP